MSAQALTAILESGIALAILAILLLRLWAGLRLDEFRQSIFVVRDELFDFAASGAISFDHPAYRLLRQSMNGFIRYAHQLTWFRLVCNMILWQLHEDHAFTWADRWDSALKTIPDESLRRELTRFQARTLALVVERLVTGSPFLIAMVAVMVVSSMLQSQWVNLRQLVGNAATGAVNRIVDPRFLEEEAARA